MTGRALMLTHTAPLPLVSGERVRNFHLLRELARRGWSVSLFALNHGPAPSAADEDVLRELCERVELEPFDASSIARYRRLAAAVSTRTAFQRRFFFSRTAAERLTGWLRNESFDAFVAESLYMYPYLPADARRLSVLDTLNAEVRRVQAMAAVLGHRPRGLVARLQLEPVRRFEAEAAQAVARVVAVSDEEGRYFDGLAPGKVDVVPNGVDCEGIATRPSLPAEPRLLFVGSMDYSANVDAVEHLIDDVLPRLARSDAVVELVGSNPRPAVRRAAERSAVSVEVHGQVPSTEPYFERARLLVVPLRFGGGTRLKILEALARGVPVVSTTLGCEGLGLTHERNVVVADSPEELAAWIDRLLEDDDLCRRLGREGRATVEERYDWRRLGEAFEAVVRGVSAKAPA
jgi:glycosyltransferase involved in cell wall biosynthesis